MTLAASSVAPHISQFTSPLSVDPKSGELYLRNAPAIPVRVVDASSPVLMVALLALIGGVVLLRTA